MKKFIKNNWIFLLFVIPFIFICFNNKRPDNDIWFLLNNGRYVLEHGIPHIDPFTIHEGLNYVMQQWLTSLLMWLLYSSFGKLGILTMVYVTAFILMFVYYKLCFTISENKNLSVIITTVTFCLFNMYIVSRPQIFTYLILILEILLLELYVKKDNSKYLYALPFLSILLINLHASMWWFQFIFMLPFLLNTIKIKKITIDKVRIKPLIIVMILMFIGGFINPYGYKGITFIFKSYGVSSVNKVIGEMKSPIFSSSYFKITLACIFLLLFIANFFKNLRLDIRHYLFIGGITILVFMHYKCYPYFIFVYFYCLSYYIKNYKFKKFKILDNKYIKSVFRGIKVGIAVMLFITLIFTTYLSYCNYSFEDIYIDDIVDYMLDNYDKDDIKLYVEFNNGAYAEYMGIKSYIDTRAELFLKNSNGKDDIFDESIHIFENDKFFDYDAFVNKYGFTHILVNMYINSNFDEYLQSNDKYEVVYEQHFDDTSDSFVMRKLYALKEG